MERVFTPPIKKQAKCKQCGEEYEAKLVLIGKEYKDTSSGYCENCRLPLVEKSDNGLINGVRKTWQDCNIPLKFKNANFSSLELRGNLNKVIKICQDYAVKFPLCYSRLLDGGIGYPSLMLCGNYGVGKTHLVCAIANRIIDRWNGEKITCPIILISEPDIYRQIQATFHYSYGEKQEKECEEDIIRRLVYIPLLIIDDIGKEQRQDQRFVQRILFSIIDSRYKLSKPVVVTTNLSADELDSYLGGGTESASYDRLFEMCKGNMWFINTTSYRKLE